MVVWVTFQMRVKNRRSLLPVVVPIRWGDAVLMKMGQMSGAEKKNEGGDLKTTNDVYMKRAAHGRHSLRGES